ncbi:TerD family protein [Streptomyces sp. NPDC053427]|uniref:TerD family protein n=1 Tax=Streptomyces sp. NPDC053427 TaxID=3365701 RepID=UPI0037D5AAD3
MQSVRNAYTRIATPDGQEIARYNISEETATASAMLPGELNRYRGKWNFRAVGQGYAPYEKRSPARQRTVSRN